jgi:excisionase family DNA binding protein
MNTLDKHSTTNKTFPVIYKKEQKAMDGNSVEGPIFYNYIESQILSYQQLSDWLGVPVSTIQKWVHRREIPYCKAGRHVRFEAGKVIEWLRRNGDHSNGI